MAGRACGHHGNGRVILQDREVRHAWCWAVGGWSAACMRNQGAPRRVLLMQCACLGWAVVRTSIPFSSGIVYPSQHPVPHA